MNGQAFISAINESPCLLEKFSSLPDQSATASYTAPLRRKNKPPPARSANSTFRLAIILES
jgi:hypothetical protein